MFKELRVKDADTISDTATSYECDLPKALITSLLMRIHGTGGAGAVALDYTMVPKVRIDTDGNDKKPLELSSAQIVRRAGILFGIPPATTSAAGAYSQIPIPHYFGTEARDKRLMLDLRECSKRTLRLDFDTDLIDATRFAAGAPKFTLIAVCWLGAPPLEYVGHIRQEEALNLATGTGDTQPQSTMPIHKGGRLAFMEFLVGTVTTVENVELSANSDSVKLIMEHFKDILQRMNVERHLDTALTAQCYFDFMFLDRYKTQLEELPLFDNINDWKLVVERGTTTTTLVVVQGTILP